MAWPVPLLECPRDRGSREEAMMQDKIKGERDVIKGTIKEQAGKLGGDRSMEISGKVDQVKGEIQKKVGDVKLDHP